MQPPRFAARVAEPTRRTETLPPPSNIDLEAAVLGAVMLESHAIGTVLAMVKGNAEVFYQPAHRYIFQAITALHSRGRAIDQLTVVAELRALGLLEKSGGVGGVAGLTMRINGAANIYTHCLTLLDLYAKRRLAQIGYLFSANAHSPMSDAEELITAAYTALNDLQNARSIRQAQTLGQLFNQAIDEVKAATQAPGGLTGIPSGMAAVDKVTGGWQPSDLIILAARPGMGKTSFILSAANHAQQAGKGGALFSLEMGAMQLVKKSIATNAGYSTSMLAKGVGLSTDEAEYLRVRCAELAKSGLLIDDTPAISIGELRAKVAKAVAEHGVTIAYIDYLQLMTGEKGGNREQEIGSISRGLKLIAKENNIPVIALAQLSRAVETRGGDKKPQLSDLRESGSIEQDADLVIFLYRAEYYKIMQDEMGNPTEGLTEVLIAKHRNGATMDVVVQSDMRTGRYSDLEADKPFEVPAETTPTAFPPSTFDTDGPPPF